MRTQKLTLTLIISAVFSLTLLSCATTSSTSSSTPVESNEQTLTSVSSSSLEVKPSEDAPDDGSVYLLKKVTSYDDDGNIVYTQKRSFDAHGNVTKVTYTEGGETEESQAVTVSEDYSDFTDDGYAQTITSEYGKVTRSYTQEDGKLIEKTTPEEDEGSTTTYEFYPSGILKSKTEVTKQDEETTTTTTTTYYEQGYIASIETTGGKEYFASYTWTFDAIGNPIDYHKYVKGNGSDESYYYVETDGKGNIASINRAKDGQAIYEYEYQKISNPSKAAFVDAMTKEI